jgi:hypothetical protein
MIFLATVYTYIYGINNFDGFKQVLPTNAFTAYTYTIMHHNIFLGLLTPIISIIASYNIIFKTEPMGKKTMWNLAQCCIFSGGAFCIAQLIILLFYCAFFHADIDAMVPPTMGPMVGVFEYSRSLYFFLSFVNSFMIAATYACLSYSIAVISNNKLFSIVLPYIIYRSTVFSGDIFYILPSDSFSAEAIPGRTLLSYYSSIIIVFVIAIVLAILKFRKGRYIK